MAIPAPGPRSAALVTGASSGVGTEVARRLAARGHNVVLLARRKDRLDDLAKDLEETHRVRAFPLPCDLSDVTSRVTTRSAIEDLGLDIEVVAHCAGRGMSGEFHRHPVDEATAMVRTNFEAAVEIVGTYVPAMVERRRGAVLLVSSLAGNGPVPGFTAYAATKAAITSFGESLHGELKRYGIAVTVVAPAGMDTEFGSVAGLDALIDRTPKALKATAAECADIGIAGLDRNRRVVIPNPVVRMMGVVGAHLPHAISLRVWPRVFY
jgi:short-subunit dehydrogenase